MSDLKKLTELVRKFRDDRDWMQFHNHKDMATGLALEAAEVMEHFHWKSPVEMAQHAVTHKGEIADELADVAVYLLELSDNLGIDLGAAIEAKLAKNCLKYPVSKSKGNHKKYTELL